jgi:hypothetical protein
MSQDRATRGEPCPYRRVRKPLDLAPSASWEVRSSPSSDGATERSRLRGTPYADRLAPTKGGRHREGDMHGCLGDLAGAPAALVGRLLAGVGDDLVEELSGDRQVRQQRAGGGLCVPEHASVDGGRAEC